MTHPLSIIHDSLFFLLLLLYEQIIQIFVKTLTGKTITLDVEVRIDHYLLYSFMLYMFYKLYINVFTILFTIYNVMYINCTIVPRNNNALNHNVLSNIWIQNYALTTKYIHKYLLTSLLTPSIMSKPKSKIKKEFPPTNNASSSPENSWKMAVLYPTTTSRRNPLYTWC